jgi:hypothetical protein
MGVSFAAKFPWEGSNGSITAKVDANTYGIDFAEFWSVALSNGQCFSQESLQAFERELKCLWFYRQY